VNYIVDFTTIELISTQYVWKYNSEVNTHTYFKIPAGTRCHVCHMQWSSLGIEYYVVKTPGGDKLKLGKTAFRIVEGVI
jgi:hypothetical protein